MKWIVSRRRFLTAAGILPALAAVTFGASFRTARHQTGSPLSNRPNVLLILTDQQSNIALGANGNPYLKTPAMDSLAAEGVSFTQSYATYPVCSLSLVFIVPTQAFIRVAWVFLRETTRAASLTSDFRLLRWVLPTKMDTSVK